jgi:hypothetical protein
MEHALEIIVLLLVKAPGRSIPMFGQFVNSSMQKKIEG